MNTRAYWCEVFAEGQVYGTGETAAFVMGTFGSISPKLALRWLRGQAARIANGLDPDPEQATWAESWMRVDSPAPDCPTALRTWIGDLGEQQAARAQLADGAPLSVVVADGECRFTLIIWPVAVPAPEPVPTLPVGDEQPTHARPGHRKARRSGWLTFL